ncbi:MAG: DUF2231 domain-containing protein [Bacteroidota bacterium]
MNSTHFHPMVVHFPIALLIVGFLYEAISVFFCKEHKLSKAGMWLIILGTLGAWAAYFTGEYFTDEMTGARGELKESHELFAKIVMYTMLAVSALRIWINWKKMESGNMKWVMLVLMLAMAACVGYTGFLGGSLVYDQMIVF